MPKNPVSIKLPSDDLNKVREYRQWRNLPTQTMALIQMVRFSYLCYQYADATDIERRSGIWYKAPRDFTERTPIDEMSAKERELFMRAFLHNFGDRLWFNNNSGNSNNNSENSGLDDIL